MGLFALVSSWLVGGVNIILILTALFLILLVLIQRGRGGGLAGAFGGAGGQSAFGSKAGDAFTKFTIYVATAWVLLLMIEIKLVQNSMSSTPSRQTVAGPAQAPGGKTPYERAEVMSEPAGLSRRGKPGGSPRLIVSERSKVGTHPGEARNLAGGTP